MSRNPILEEIHATRELLLAEYKGDIHAYVQAARERALASGRPIAVPKQRSNQVSNVVGVAGTEVRSPSARRIRS